MAEKEQFRQQRQKELSLVAKLPLDNFIRIKSFVFKVYF